MGVRGGAPQFRLDRRGRHRRAASVARLTPRMCGACAVERRKFDSIGVGATGTQRRWLFQATEVRGVRGGAPQVLLDRRGHHRRAAFVARFTPRMCGAYAGELRKFDSIDAGVTGAPHLWPVLRHGCAGRERGSTASSTRSGWAPPARSVDGSFRPRTCGACAGERRKFDSIGVGITGAMRLWPV